MQGYLLNNVCHLHLRMQRRGGHRDSPSSCTAGIEPTRRLTVHRCTSYSVDTRTRLDTARKTMQCVLFLHVAPLTEVEYILESFTQTLFARFFFPGHPSALLSNIRLPSARLFASTVTMYALSSLGRLLICIPLISLFASAGEPPSVIVEAEPLLCKIESVSMFLVQ